tara:strand:- start:5123 stop:6037 length:915 start_codon:yes stop_codon:yes gene_type:complete
MSNTTDAVNYNGFTPAILETIPENNGVNGRAMLEPIPEYIKSPCEHVIDKGNSWIVLGRDRPASRASGYAGQGHTQASSIDIVVGRGAPVPANLKKLDPDFSNDAARIYISQKADIDDYFEIGPNPPTPDNPWQLRKSKLYSKSVSAIGIKADAVRIIGDMGIKLVTRSSASNSKGGSIAPNGIELVANNDDAELQPIVRGDNMVEALSALEDKIAELSSCVLNFLKDQSSFNDSLTSHTHVSPVGPTLSSAELVPAGMNATMSTVQAQVDNFEGRVNLNINWHNKYLNPVSSKYICSKYNKVN